MAIVNKRREAKGKPAIKFGIICPDPTDPKSALNEAQLLVELTLLNEERAAMGSPAMHANWACSAVRFDCGKNRQGHWKALHVLQHVDEFMDVLEVVMPDCKHLFIFDNSSGHGAFAEDALLAQKMSKGWGGKQPLTWDTERVDSEGTTHEQKVVFVEADRINFLDGPVSRHSGRLKQNEGPPDWAGCTKGAHKVLCERGVVEAKLGNDTAALGTPARNLFSAFWRKEEGCLTRTLTNGTALAGLLVRLLKIYRSHWRGATSPLWRETTRDAALCCVFSASTRTTLHVRVSAPPPAGLKVTGRVLSACVAEEALRLGPLHLSPAQALKAASEALHCAAIAGAVESEELDSNVGPASFKTGLTWLRWRPSTEQDFKGEQDVLQTRIRERGHLCESLSKFHCDINWAENHWGKSKPHARKLVDGGLDENVPGYVVVLRVREHARSLGDAICPEGS